MMEWQKLLNLERRRQSESYVGDSRTELERDYNRAVFSTPVRRLQDKAQVFPLEPHDSVRTRLTHSLEVSTVARDLAYKVANELCKEGTLATGLDYPSQISTIAATCGLIHDIGNPPFGHSGEEAIKTWFQKKIGNKGDEIDKIKNFTPQQSNDFLEFEGNAQTLRLIAKLQVLADTYGLNLTYATLSASCKYLAPSHSVDTDQNDVAKRHDWSKPGYFASEKDLVKEIRKATGTGDCRNPITFLVEAADDIVYSVVDIEDGIKKGVVNWNTARKILELDTSDMMEECFKRVDSYSEKHFSGLAENIKTEAQAQMFRVNAIFLLVKEATQMFKRKYSDIMDGTYHEELLQDDDSSAKSFINTCKGFARKYVYTHREVLLLELMGREVIHDLRGFCKSPCILC